MRRGAIDILNPVRYQMMRTLIRVMPLIKKEVGQSDVAKTVACSQAMISRAVQGGDVSLDLYTGICTALDIRFTLTLDNNGLNYEVESFQSYHERYLAGLVKFKLTIE